MPSFLAGIGSISAILATSIASCKASRLVLPTLVSSMFISIVFLVTTSSLLSLFTTASDFFLTSPWRCGLARVAASAACFFFARRSESAFAETVTFISIPSVFAIRESRRGW